MSIKLYPIKSDISNIEYTISGYKLKGKVTKAALDNIIAWTDDNILYILKDDGKSYNTYTLNYVPQEIILSKINDEINIIAATDSGSYIYNLNGVATETITTSFSKKVIQFNRDIYILTDTNIQKYNLDTKLLEVIFLNDYSEYYFVANIQGVVTLCLMFDTFLDTYIESTFFNRIVTPFIEIEDTYQYSDELVLVRGSTDQSALINFIVQEDLIPISTEDNQLIYAEDSVELFTLGISKGIFLYNPLLNTCELLTELYNVNLYNYNASASNA